jgi:hypothetical protein
VNAYEDGQEAGAQWFTLYASGVLKHHGRDVVADRIVAERVYEVLAAQSVGWFLRAAACAGAGESPPVP